MNGGNIYDVVDHYSTQGKLAYVHLRNVVGKVRKSREVFIDEDDIELFRVLNILNQNNLDDVLIPDHTPRMTYTVPWHPGVAHTLGWMRAAITAVQQSYFS